MISKRFSKIFEKEYKENSKRKKLNQVCKRYTKRENDGTGPKSCYFSKHSQQYKTAMDNLLFCESLAQIEVDGVDMDMDLGMGIGNSTAGYQQSLKGVFMWQRKSLSCTQNS